VGDSDHLLCPSTGSGNETQASPSRTQAPADDHGSIRFEQFERHPAWDRDGGLRNRSGAGDLDVIVYSLRKRARLAADDNPTVLPPPFVPEDEIVVGSPTADEVRANAHRFARQRSIQRFLGHLESQPAAMDRPVA